MVTSPLNRSGWHLVKLCLAGLATSHWLLVAKVSKGMPENVSLGVECSAGCLTGNPEGCGLLNVQFVLEGGFPITLMDSFCGFVGDPIFWVTLVVWVVAKLCCPPSVGTYLSSGMWVSAGELSSPGICMLVGVSLFGCVSLTRGCSPSRMHMLMGVWPSMGMFLLTGGVLLRLHTGWQGFVPLL